MLVNIGSGNRFLTVETKQFPEPMLTSCQLDAQQQTDFLTPSKYELKYNDFHTRKCTEKCCPQNGGHFHSGLIGPWEISITS